MKKLIYSAAVMALAFFAASCQQENLEPVATDNTVTYTVQIADAVATKALGDNVTVVDKVYYQVYRAAEVDKSDKTFVYDGEAEVNEGKASFELEFVKNQNFVVLFWAQNSALVNTDVTSTDGMFNINDLRAVQIVNPGTSNNANAQVFAGKDIVNNCSPKSKGNVTLVRPISQLNIFTTKESLKYGEKTITLSESTVTVKGLYTTYNVAAGEDAGEAVVTPTTATYTYNSADVPETKDTDTYAYVAMNYVGFAPKAGATVDVNFTIKTSEGDVPHSVSNVPVKPNYRTNIVGNLLTEATNYDVTLNAEWAQAEITHAYDATSAQAALDNAVAGSVIQLHPGVNYGTLYMRPIAGGAHTKVVDWIGNNYGFETYSLFEDITIYGAEGATVDAIKIEGGTYYHTAHSQADKYPVMLSLIELKNVVLDGVTFTGKGGYDPQGYGNAINLSGSNIKVDGLTLNNCVLKSKDNNARLIYKTETTTHVHNYAYNGETFTFSPSMKDITVTGCKFNGGYMGLELRETENVTITNNEFNVADRNILLAVNTGCTYSGNITITGNVSNNAKERFVRADGTGDAIVVIKDNIINNYQGADADFIKVSNGNNVTIENNTNAYTAATAEDLASLVNNATSDMTIVLTADLEGKIELWQNASVNITIDGNDKKYTGAIRIINLGGATDRSMTIKNINFDGTGLSDKEGCIYTSVSKTVNQQNYNSYIANVTIEDCTFTGPGVAAFRQNNGGDINLTIKNCTVDNTMHSFIQAKNFAKKLTVENCEVYSKNGVNLNNTHDASFTGCEFDVKGYVVRVGVDDNSDSTAKTYTFTSCTLKSECNDGDAVIIVRNTANDATLNFVDTEVIGSTIIKGYTNDTKVSGIPMPQKNNEIWYTSSEMALVPTNPDAINANVVSNVWDKTTGKGVLTFDAQLTTIGEKAFQRVTNTTPSNWATSISLPEGVETIGNYAFAQCYSLTSIVIPDSVESIGQYAFQNCDAVKTVTIGSGIQYINSGAFYNCYEIEEIICKSTTPPIMADNWVFNGVDKAAKVIVPAAEVDTYKAAQFWSSFTNIVAE